jgi:hypothetical protein
MMNIAVYISAPAGRCSWPVFVTRTLLPRSCGSVTRVLPRRERLMNAMSPRPNRLAALIRFAA